MASQPPKPPTKPAQPRQGGDRPIPRTVLSQSAPSWPPSHGRKPRLIRITLPSRPFDWRKD